MASHGGIGTVLAPPCETNVHKAWIRLDTALRADSKTFCRAGPERFDQNVGRVDQRSDHFATSL